MRILLLIILLTTLSSAGAAAGLEFIDDRQGTLHISCDGRQVADYVYENAEITRPYFASVYAPNGIQVTRRQPPDLRKDIADHPLFHPGIWLSFGDINGSDYWRLAAKAKFVAFEQTPQAINEGGEFSVRYQYLSQQDPSEIVCDEMFRCKIMQLPAGMLVMWDSTFTSKRQFAFGDQEEMGLGIRMATPLRAEHQTRNGIAPGTGAIIDAEGRRNGAEVWGHAAQWCDYSGTIDGEEIGATIFVHPGNFRPSWFHARDYGLLVANPFGRKAFNHGESSRVVVRPGDELRLRYGIFLHTGKHLDLDAMYKDYVKLSSKD